MKFAYNFVKVFPICRIGLLSCYNHRQLSTQSKPRDNPFIMKLDSVEFQSLFTVELMTLATIFKNHNYELRIAGGAVRDLLMHKKPKDLDFATTATPDEMKQMFEKEGVRMINNKGEKHGTITPRINNKENFEVTTLRIDRETDGRHAEVEFTKDWKLDANRRDLTINSMFLGLDGTLYDYFHGYDDLMKRRVVFVGDATKRIQEDYLRILRYFRFYGRIAEEPSNHDVDTIDAIKENAAGLAQISGERIWMELNKILSGNFWGELMLLILDCGLGPHIGMPKESDVGTFAEFYRETKNVPLHPVTRVSPLFKSEDEFAELHERLKMSAFERDLGFFVVNHRNDSVNLRWCKYNTIMLQTKHKLSHLQDWIQEMIKYKRETAVLHEYVKWNVPKFPVNGGMLQERGIPMDRNTNHIINKLKEFWVENDCAIDSEKILEHVPVVLEEIKNSPPNTSPKFNRKKKKNV
ncbi:CCA tRNA nucleotidyltransferase 1, mitochondrial isoform X2 [Macrosteles quadrilineatus]|uniref:CCA tRNA nucleotidyltransferase 1, mitochondrial isoform X2 n=1 Tax=Macrosteles quadrilineatus TaxID=74068 RepID=UPI0023E1B519|nr:CCA tRNA nucleotidyltransferase 1, mitochondrial isoform X2 [Macrosteles quadrilineatus]